MGLGRDLQISKGRKFNEKSKVRTIGLWNFRPLEPHEAGIKVPMFESSKALESKVRTLERCNSRPLKPHGERGGGSSKVPKFESSKAQSPKFGTLELWDLGAFGLRSPMGLGLELQGSKVRKF